MKKANKILLSLYLPTFLLAQGATPLKKAVKSYNEAAFSESYSGLKENLNESSDVGLKFMLARSAYEIGKFDEAHDIYKEILQKEPDNVRVKLELAQTKFQLKRYDEAKVLYEEVLKEKQIPLAVRNNVELTLNSLKQKTQKNFLKGTVGIGYGYDSNANNSSNEDFIYLRGLPLKVDNKKKSDIFLEYLASINHAYKINDNLAIENKLGAYVQNYNKQDGSDLGIATLATGLAYYGQNYKASLGFEFSYVRLDNNEYLRAYAIAPSLEYQLYKNLLYKAKLKFMKKDFRQTAYDFRDSIYYELQNALVLSTQKFGLNTFMLTVGTDDKSKGKTWNVDNDFIGFKYENSYPLTQSTLLLSGIELYGDRYKVEEEVFYQNKKHDVRVSADIAAIQSITKNLSFGVSFRYTNNASNQNLYEYDKYVTKANIYYSF